MSVDAAARMSAPAPRDPSWVALAAGQATLAVWLGLLLAADGLGAGSSVVLARAVSPTGAAALGVFGFAVPAVFGMFPRLAPGLLGLPRTPPAAHLAAAGAGAAMSALALAWVAVGDFALVGIQGLAAAGGGGLLVSLVARGRRARRDDLPIAPPSPRAALPGNAMLGAALAYLIGGGTALAAVALAPAAVAGAGLAVTLAWPLHLVTVGFLALAVFGVGTRMFASFASREAPAAAVWAVAAPGIAAPAGIAWGLARFDFPAVALFGAVALAAAAAFAALVLWMWRHQARRRRAAWFLLVAGSLSLVAGETMGALFGLRPGLIAYAGIHAQTNVLGFAGLTIFGVLFMLSGREAARPDTMFGGAWIALLWPAAIALRAIAALAGLPAPAVLADAVLLGSYLVAARASHPRRRAPAAPRQGAV